VHDFPLFPLDLVALPHELIPKQQALPSTGEYGDWGTFLAA
jgi:hypothetical protein